jgi:glutamyl-tRNA reductase
LPLYALGLNHKTAALSVRETVAFSVEAQPAALRALQIASMATEVSLLSTCNRTEVYLAGADESVMHKAAVWLVDYARSNANVRSGADVAPHIYQLQHEAAANHLFSVAAGLDSMILGEPQILGQVKFCARVAAETGTLNGPLDRLFQQAFSVAKEVRTDTDLGAASVSMAAATMKLAQQLFGELNQVRILLIGAGEMIELCAMHFAAQRPKCMVVANRTHARAMELAARLGVGLNGAVADVKTTEAITLKEVPERLHEFDLVISSTASSLPIIGKGMVESALKLRRRKPMMLVDLAVPRDIEAQVQNLADVFLYTLDSLGNIIARNMVKREGAVEAAKKIVDTRTAEFMRWLQSRSSVSTIVQLRGKAEEYRQLELVKARKLLLRGDDPAAVLEALSTGLMNKFLHHPLAALNSADAHEREALAATIAKLFPSSDEE